MPPLAFLLCRWAPTVRLVRLDRELRAELQLRATSAGVAVASPHQHPPGHDALLCLFLALLAVAYFTLLGGCTQMDGRFRERVESVTISGTASQDGNSGNASITAGGTIHFRDPRATGLAK